MSDLFFPISSAQLIEWVFTELESHDSIFGIPRQHFFVPRKNDPFRTSAFGHPLETPFGPAAGPHSQMAQNIVAAWLCGARYIELKTEQTLDELNVSKPCIDMQDEGYNVEWSQELKIYQSFDEYLRAWVLIHALHHKLDFSGRLPNGYGLICPRKYSFEIALGWVPCQRLSNPANARALIGGLGGCSPPGADRHCSWKRGWFKPFQSALSFRSTCSIVELPLIVILKLKTSTISNYQFSSHLDIT